MKKRLIPLALLALSFCPMQADDVSLGYCDGSVISQQVDASGQTSVAVKFADSDFSMYHGSRIIGVRLGVASDLPAGVTVFVRDQLTGDNLYTMQTPALYQGWNDVEFAQPVDYPKGDLVIGYTIPQGGIGRSGETWPDGYWMLENGTWKDHSSEQGGSLCIQALIDGESYGVNDAALLRVDKVTAGKDKPFTFSGVVRNNTNADLDHFALSYTIGDVTTEQEVSLESVLPGELGSFSFEATAPATTGKYTMTATISSVSGKADEFASNNTAAAELDVLGELVKKRVLVENFTTQTCVNCPAAHGRLKEALQGRDDYVLVAHHYGNGTDDLTAPSTSDMQWFYNSNKMFAPGVMIDRVNLMESTGPIFVVPESKTITAMLDELGAERAPVAVEVLRNYDSATRKLKIRVNTHVVEGEDVTGSPVVTVLLLEDGIIAPQSPGYDNYEHNDVCRMFVSPVYGDPVIYVGNEEVRRDYEVDVAGKWNADNMHIVAFVSNYDKIDCNNCHVYNATEVTLNGQDDIPTAIVETTTNGAASKATPVAAYTLSGQRTGLDGSASGIRIIRMSDGTVRKVAGSLR